MPCHNKSVGPVGGTNAALRHVFLAFNADTSDCVCLEAGSDQLLDGVLVNVEDELFFFDAAGQCSPCLGAEVDKGLRIIGREAAPIGVHREALSAEVVNKGESQPVAVRENAVGGDAKLGRSSAEPSARSYGVRVRPMVGNEKTVALPGREDIFVAPGGEVKAATGPRCRGRAAGC